MKPGPQCVLERRLPCIEESPWAPQRRDHVTRLGEKIACTETLFSLHIRNFVGRVTQCSQGSLFGNHYVAQASLRLVVVFILYLSLHFLYFYIYLFLFLFLRQGLITHDSFELVTLLPSPPKCWTYVCPNAWHHGCLRVLPTLRLYFPF